MPFKHIVDTDKNIVVLKATGNVTEIDIINEIQKAINTERGKGITRRMIDMTDQTFSYDLENAQKILKMMKASAEILGSRKIAILFKKIPDTFDMKKIQPLQQFSSLEIKFFTDKEKAVQFLNKPAKKRK